MAKERVKWDADNRQAFGDFSEVIPYLNETVGFDLTAIGVTDTKVIQASEAFIGEMFTRYVCEIQETDAAYFRWVSAEEFMFWTGTGWKSGDAETMRSIIRRVLLDAGAGRVYSFYSPRRVAKEVLAELCQHTDKQYTPTTDMIAFRNGVLDINTLELRPFSIDLQPRFTIGYDYDPEATCPKFTQAVSDALDEETAAVFQEACGNLLLGYQHEIVPILTGGGQNGKSTLLEGLTAAFGEKDVTAYNLSEITVSDGRYVSNMQGAIANIAFDSSITLKIGNENLFKCYASGEPLPCKVLYKQPTMTRLYPKSLIALNGTPATSDYSLGYFRRLLLIPFSKKIDPTKVNLNLKAELKAERAGILNWVLEGMIRLRDNGHFTHSEAVIAAGNQYRTDSDSVASFIDEEGWKPSDKPDKTLADLFQIFEAWRQKMGYAGMTARKFSSRLRGLGIKVEKQGGTIRAWITNKSDEDMPF